MWRHVGNTVIVVFSLFLRHAFIRDAPCYDYAFLGCFFAGVSPLVSGVGARGINTLLLAEQLLFSL